MTTYVVFIIIQMYYIGWLGDDFTKYKLDKHMSDSMLFIHMRPEG